MDPSFWKDKVYADIRGSSEVRGRQMYQKEQHTALDLIYLMLYCAYNKALIRFLLYPVRGNQSSGNPLHVVSFL